MATMLFHVQFVHVHCSHLILLIFGAKTKSDPCRLSTCGGKHACLAPCHWGMANTRVSVMSGMMVCHSVSHGCV